MGRHVKSSRGVSSKMLIVLLALVLMIGCAVGGTVAWLTAKTDSVVNTFTYGDINIELTETTGKDYKIIPGVDIAKDPKVTVEAGSEDCWLFVEVKESGEFVSGKVTYAISDGWTKGDGTDIPANVYYRVYSATATDTIFDILKDNEVTVSDTLTKADIQNITTNPTLTFTAYAVQKDNMATAAAAWAAANPTATPTPSPAA